MAFYITYNDDTGEIRKLIEAPTKAVAELNCGVGFSVLDVGSFPDPEAQKVNLTSRTVESKTTQSITATPTTIDADGSEKSVLTGIAEGSTAKIRIDGNLIQRISVDSGKMNFVTETVATHTITFTHPLYLDTEVEITAVTP